MKFYRPTTISGLSEIIKIKDENTFFSAGATDLLVKLKNNSCFNYSIIDLSNLDEIKEIEMNEKRIKIGASVTMTMLKENEIVREYAPALSKAASMIGSTQIRNLATIGGNIANAAQCADTMPVLFAYKADAYILTEGGKIEVRPAETLIAGIEKNTLKSNEVILFFEFDKNNHYSYFSKIGARKAVTISKVNACIKADLKENIIKNPVVYLGSVGIKALPAPIIEKALRGQDITDINEEKLQIAVETQIEENIPNRSSKHYKKSAAFGVVMDIIDNFPQAKGGFN